MFTVFSLVAAAAFCLWYYSAYNALVQHRNATEQSWSNVEVELKRRFDLIQNLVAVVKGYATHEREVFESVTKLRAQSEAEKSPAEAVGFQRELASVLTKVVAIAEGYPELKANDQYLQLQTELTETENRIAERRNAYNRSVNFYLNVCHQFPSNVIASVHGFEPKAFFDAPDELVSAAPSVTI